MIEDLNKVDNVLSDIQRIAEAIKEHRVLEDNAFATNKAVATYEVLLNNNEFTLWLVNGAIDSGISFGIDFVGNPVIFKNNSLTLHRHGKNRVVSKNSIMAGKLIMSETVNFSFDVEGHHNKVALLSKADFYPFNNDGDATNLTIRFKKEEVFYTYKSLREILEEIDSKKKQIGELEKLKLFYVDDDTEINECLEQQRKVERDLKELYRKKQDFILEHAKLRYKAILDPIQEKIKRSNFYDNHLLLIEGGPGTGKTTTLIQRIKYLIDPIVIAEHEKLFTGSEKEKILNQESPCWIFFSPNELLYLYLKESMTKEGLRATSHTGKVWSQYRTSLIWKYDLSNKKTKKPFLLCRDKEYCSLFASCGESFIELRSAFEKALIADLNQTLNGLLENVSASTMKLSSSLKQHINTMKVTNVIGFINLCVEINKKFGPEILVFKEEFEERLGKSATILKNNIKRDNSILLFMQQKFSTYYSISIPNSSEFNSEVDKMLGYNSFENWLFTQSSHIVKTAAGYSLLEDEKKYNDYLVSNKVDPIFLRLFKIATIRDLGKVQSEWEVLTVFKDSISSLILDRIAPAYLSFRKSSTGLATLKHVNTEILSKLTHNEDNRLHPNEQSFLVGMINEILKNVYRNSRAEYDNLNHKYKNAFEEISKMVIAVDEVSDFHLLDLFGIFSLGDKVKSSITLCGDIMQRIEDVGIYHWDDIQVLNSSLKKHQLGTSYRQSPTLLQLASVIFKESTSEELNIKPYLEKHENEPKVICKISSDEEVKIRWIANKILEIYDFYGGEMPSVAVFLSSEDLIESFATNLGNVDDLADVGIEVKACKNGEVLGSGSMVRVFSLRYIKGLEFEAVIFHNLDDLLNQGSSPDTLLRKVYVGLSRATFYLAVSLSDNWCKELNFLTDCFSNEDSWQTKNLFYAK